jgi:hypothetical protein
VCDVNRWILHRRQCDSHEHRCDLPLTLVVAPCGDFRAAAGLLLGGDALTSPHPLLPSQPAANVLCALALLHNLQSVPNSEVIFKLGLGWGFTTQDVAFRM